MIQASSKLPSWYRFWRWLAVLEILIALGGLFLLIPFMFELPKNVDSAREIIYRYFDLDMLVGLAGFGIGIIVLTMGLGSMIFRHSLTAGHYLDQRDRLLWAILLIGLICIIALYVFGPNMGLVLCQIRSGACS
jgi:hypothetical protein